MTDEQSARKIARLLSDPANTENVAKAYLLLGLDAEERLDWENAIEQYRRVIELAPEDVIVRYFGYNNRAYALLQLRRFEEAEAHGIAALEVDDGRHNAYKNLGLAYQALEQPVTAAEYFINASFRNPEDKRAWLHLQQLLIRDPSLLAEAPEVAEEMEAMRKYYAANGGVPSLN